jgi:hypothetical protein
MACDAVTPFPGPTFDGKLPWCADAKTLAGLTILRLTARLPVPAAGAAFTQPSACHGACLRTPRARPQVRQPQIRYAKALLAKEIAERCR